MRVPVAVTCRVLKLCRQAYYRWLEAPVTDADWVAAHRANALFDAHHDDAEFGYRFLADEARDAGQPMADRTAWRLCSTNRWWSVFGKPKAYGKARRPGAPPTTTASSVTCPRKREVHPPRRRRTTCG